MRSILTCMILCAPVLLLQARAASIINHADYSETVQTNVNLTGMSDWWIHGAAEATETFAEKTGSAIVLTGQGGGTVLAQDRTAHSYVWADGSGTVDNPSGPAAHNPGDYRRRQYDIGLLGGASALDLTKGAYYSVEIPVGHTGPHTVTVYGLARRNDEIYFEATLRDRTKTVTRATLAPQLLGTQSDTGAEASFSFSFTVQADEPLDVLSFTLAGYNDAASTDRSLTLDAVTVATVDGPGFLSSAEIGQIEQEFGITLTPKERQQLSSIVYAPPAAWRADAYDRIEQYRKVDLDIQTVDKNGQPIPGVEVSVKLKRNDFKFGACISAEDFSGKNSKITAETYQGRILSLFNSIGTNNGFKPKLPYLHANLPGIISWGKAHNIPVRGHLLIWPGNGELADLNDPNKVAGVDYGSHLSAASTSAYASYNVLGAVETYKNSARTQADKDALEAVVDAEIQEWAGRWDVYEWDVINETLDNHLLQDILGQDQMAEWFKIAEQHVVSPDCKLAINDYQIISAVSTAKHETLYANRSAQYFANIDRILADGGRIDRIGFQSRIKSERREPELIYNRLKEWGDRYGFEMVGTEFEVLDTTGSWNPYTYTDIERNQITEEMLTQYFSHPLVTGLSHWNAISDSVTSLVNFNGRPSANGLVWYYLHKIRFNTDETRTSDENGRATGRAFKGEYEMTVHYNGQDFTSTLVCTNDETVVIDVDALGAARQYQPQLIDLQTTFSSGSATSETFDFPVEAGDVIAVLAASNSGSDPSVGSVTFTGVATDAAMYENNNNWGASASYWHTQATAPGTLQVSITTGAGYASFGLYHLRAKPGYNLIKLADAKAGYGSNDLSSSITNTYAFSESVSGIYLEGATSFNRVTPLSTGTTVDLSKGAPSRSVAHGTFTDAPSFESVWTNENKSVSLIGLAFGCEPGDTRVETPGTHYAIWRNQYNLSGDTGLSDNPDGDAYNNLAEYAFGGNPTNKQDAGYAPIPAQLQHGGDGTNYVKYVYTKRRDAAARGLNYLLQTTDDLANGGWTETGFVYDGEGSVDGEFNTVTNRLPAVDPAGFIRVKVQFTP